MIFSKNLSGFPQQEDPRKQGVILLESGMHAGRAACTICIWPACRPNLHLSSILVSHPSMKSTLHCLFLGPIHLEQSFQLIQTKDIERNFRKSLDQEKKVLIRTEEPSWGAWSWRYQLQLTQKSSLKWNGKGNRCRISLSINKDWTFPSD